MTLALLLIMFGASSIIMAPKLIQQKIEQKLQLKIGTKTYERFTRVPIPLTVRVYMFHVANAERVLAGLERPHYEEVGPFMFKQWRRREIVDHEDNNRRLRYREIKTYYPILPSAGGSDSVADAALRAQALDPRQYNITSINVPMLAVLTRLAPFEGIKRSIVATALNNLFRAGRDKILITKSANEWLFEGFKVDFMEAARDLFTNYFNYNFDSPLPGNKFGFFYLKNGTWSRREAGELTVFTGRNESMNDFMLVDNWNDMRKLHVWPANTEAGERCNQIVGTDGSQFHPGVTRDTLLSIFAPQACRSLQIKYKEDTEARGIPLYRFVMSPDNNSAPRKNPRNACYCTIAKPTRAATNYLTSSSSTTTESIDMTRLKANSSTNSKQIDDSRCYLDGLMDLSACQRGAPIAASAPHFYAADPMLAAAAGLKPDKRRHETHLDIEPMTGAVMRAASRAQINAFVEQPALDFADSSIIGNMTAMIAPIMWIEETAEIDEKSANDFKAQLLNTVHKLRVASWGSIVLGLLLVVLVALQYWYVTCYKLDKALAKTESTRRVLRQRGGGRARTAASARSRRRTPSRAKSTGSGGERLASNLRLGDAQHAHLAMSGMKPSSSGAPGKSAKALLAGAAYAETSDEELQSWRKLVRDNSDNSDNDDDDDNVDSTSGLDNAAREHTPDEPAAGTSL